MIVPSSGGLANDFPRRATKHEVMKTRRGTKRAKGYLLDDRRAELNVSRTGRKTNRQCRASCRTDVADPLNSVAADRASIVVVQTDRSATGLDGIVRRHGARTNPRTRPSATDFRACSARRRFPMCLRSSLGDGAGMTMVSRRVPHRSLARRASPTCDQGPLPVARGLIARRAYGRRRQIARSHEGAGSNSMDPRSLLR